MERKIDEFLPKNGLHDIWLQTNGHLTEVYHPITYHFANDYIQLKTDPPIPKFELRPWLYYPRQRSQIS